MTNMYASGMQDFTKAEEMFRIALDSHEKSLGKEHDKTMKCARNLAIVLARELEDKEKMRELAKR